MEINTGAEISIDCLGIQGLRKNGDRVWISADSIIKELGHVKRLTEEDVDDLIENIIERIKKNDS